MLAHRIDVGAVATQSVMQMRAGRQTGRADAADQLTLADASPANGQCSTECRYSLS